MKRRNRNISFPLIPLLLIISICLNIYLLVSPGFPVGVGQKLSLQELQEIIEPGIYGPDGLEIVDGSFFISAAGVKLQNAHINGDLFLTAGIGDGGVELLRVAVKETAVVEGGGEGTVIFEDAELNHLVINREEGKVRVVLKGDTTVKKVTIKGAASISTMDLSEKGRVGELNIETAADAELAGCYSLVNVATGKARVTVAAAGQIEKLIALEEAEEALIHLNKGAVIELFEAGAPLELAGEGLLKEVLIAAPGLFKFSTNVESISAAGRGIFLQFDSGTTGSLLVKPSEGTVMIHLAAEAVIENIELDGAAGITGSGTIKRVKINRPGTTIEQKPETVVLAEGIKAVVNGKEVAEKKPEPVKPTPSPAPSQSKSTPQKPAPPASPAATLVVDDGWPVPGEKGVRVTLNCSDPQNYTVTVGGIALKYSPETKIFAGVVRSEEAKQGKVKVARK